MTTKEWRDIETAWPEASAEGLPTWTAGSGAPIDFSEALNEFGDDREGLIEVITVFLETARGQMQTLYRALAEGEAKTVEIVAHSIKGGAATLIADDLAAAAYALEKQGNSGCLTGAESLLRRFEQELARLVGYLQDMGIGTGDEGINR